MTGDDRKGHVGTLEIIYFLGSKVGNQILISPTGNLRDFITSQT